MKKVLLILLSLAFSNFGNAQYCTTNLYSSGCSAGDDIDDFSLGSFSQSATGCPSGNVGYSDFTSSTISLTQTIPYALSATSNFSSQSMKIWIDFNDDQDFDDVGEEIYNSDPVTFGSGTALNDTLTLAQSTNTGLHRMRVRVVYFSTTFGPCDNQSFGEVHDYTVNVLPNTIGNCPAFSSIFVDSISGTAAKVEWLPGTGNEAFQLEYGPTGFTPGSGTIVSGNLPGNQPPSVLSGLSPQTTYDVYLCETCNGGGDSVCLNSPINFTTTKLCASPTSFAASNIGAYSADFTWSQSGNFQEFYFLYGSLGFDPNTGGSVDTATASPFTLPGLNPSSDYDVYLVTYCGTADGFSDTIGPLSVTTLCAPVVSYPYLEDFESITGNFPGTSFPNCWEDSSLTSMQWQSDVGGTTSSNTGPSVDHSTGTATGVYVYLETSSSGDEAFLQTPVYDLTSLTNPVFSFWYHMYGATMADLEVQASTDGGLSWTTIFGISGQQHSASNDPWTQASIDISQFNTASTIFRFRGTRGSSFTGDMAVDDLEIQEGPACPAPGVFFVSATDSSATFNIIGGGSSYEIEWGPVGFTQGNGCTASLSNGLVTLDNSTAPGCTTPFNDNTQYDVYVRNDCSANANGTSSWTGPVKFNTALEGPQGVICSGANNTFILSSEFDDQGIWGGNVGTFSGQWQYNTGNTPTGGTGPSGAHSGNNYIYFESSGGGPASLVSPMINLAPASEGAELAFWLHAYGGEVGYLAVKVSTSSANGPFNDTIFLYNSGSLQSSDSDPWQQVGVNLDNYLGQQIWLSFEADRNGGGTGDIALDLVTVETCGDYCLPEIYRLDSIAVNSINDATVYIDTSGDSFQLEWGPCGYTQGTGTFMTGSSPFNLTGLSPSSCYDVYVRRSCGGANGFSSWGGPFRFATPCELSPTNLPFSEGFEIFNDPVDNDTTFLCASDYSWDVIRPGGVGSILFDYSASSGPTPPYAGSRSAGFESTSSNDPIYLILSIDMSNYTSGTDPIQLSFHFADHADEDNPGDRVWIRGSLSDPWIEIFDWNAAGAGNNWGYFEMMLDSALSANSQSFSGSTQIRWGQQDNANLTGGDGFSLDDVIIQTLTCPGPKALNADSIAVNSAFLSWRPGTIGNNNFELSLGPDIVVPEMGTSYALSDSSFSATGLTGATEYCFFVREICSAGDTSIWEGPYCFSTPCTTFTAPYFEDFENFTTGWFAGDENCWSLGSSEDLSSAGDGYSWELRNTPQNTSSGTGPDKDNTLAPAAGGHFLTADVSYGTAGDSAMLVSPVMDLTPLSSPQLTFYLHRYGDEMADLYVDVYDGNQWVNGVLSYTNQAGIQSSEAEPYTEVKLSLGQYANVSNFRVRFTSVSNACCAGDNAIDDISIADPVPDDAEANAILIPARACGDSATAVEVVFTNQGANTITTMPVTVQISGSFNSTLNATYSGSLPSFETDTVLVGTINTYAGAQLGFDAVLGLAGDQNSENDSLTTSADFEDGMAPQPSAALDTVACSTAYDTLYFPTGSNANYYWITPGNDTIGSSDSLVVGPIAGSDTTFLLGAGPLSHQVGPVDNSIGAYANVWNPAYGLYFDVHQPMTLVSVDIFPTGPGIMQFVVEDSSGSTVASAVKTIFGGSQTNALTIELNFDIPPGERYLLRPGASTTQSVRNNTGGNYPYSIPSVMDITGNSFEGGPGNYYYYFYNWEVASEGCSKPTGAVTIYNSGSSVAPAFTHNIATATATGRSVSFDAGPTSGASSYSWNFGDGNTGTGLTAQHTYTSNGTYTVWLIASGPCGTDSVSENVVIEGVGITESPLERSLSIYPNPTEDKVTIEFDALGNAEASIRILDVRGREVGFIEYDNLNGYFNQELSMGEMAKGVYLLEIQSGSYRVHRKITLR